MLRKISLVLLLLLLLLFENVSRAGRDSQYWGRDWDWSWNWLHGCGRLGCTKG